MCETPGCELLDVIAQAVFDAGEATFLCAPDSYAGAHHNGNCNSETRGDAAGVQRSPLLTSLFKNRLYVRNSASVALTAPHLYRAALYTHFIPTQVMNMYVWPSRVCAKGASTWWFKYHSAAPPSTHIMSLWCIVRSRRHRGDEDSVGPLPLTPFGDCVSAAAQAA